MGTPLASHFAFASDDVNESMAFLARTWQPLRCRFLERAEPLGYRAHLARLRDVRLLYVELAARVATARDPHAADPFFALFLPERGCAEHRVGLQRAESSPASGVIHSPFVPVAVRHAGPVGWLLCGLRADALREELGRLLDARVGRPLEFAAPLPLTAGPGPAVRRLVAYLCREAEAAGARGAGSLASVSPLALAQAERSLMTLLLEAQPHAYSAALERPSGDAAPWHVRLVEEYARAHLDRALSLGELAALAGVSARALTGAFRRHRGASPMAFVRGLRLEAARRELLAANSRATVTAVAVRWGFANFGRFAAAYARRFGESPSATLRRRSG